jgi:hypothetical protein
VRLIYVPEREVIEVRGLEPRAWYAASYFNPVTGQKASLGQPQADARGSLKCQPPLVVDQDWVLVLKAGPL